MSVQVKAGPGAAGRDAPAGSFGRFVADVAAAGDLVVQPRMGFAWPEAMRAGLARTRALDAATIGTITLDSYTRTGDHASARRALAEGIPLNGYPIVAHGSAKTAAVLRGVAGPEFPVQVRHGSAAPEDIVAALIGSGLDATEGGPVSYCLPYGRTSLADAERHWSRSCAMLAELRENGREPHLETFGGCLLGQLCPPSLLVAVSVLEAMFFRQHGLRSVSLSYAQQTSLAQDRDAIAALRRLAAEFLPDTDWHVVLYTYMGVYPRTPAGADRLLASATRLAVHSGAERLIVKTGAEAHRIPTVQENIDALEFAAATARRTRRLPETGDDPEVLAEARTLIESVLCLADDIGAALVAAFRRSHLDIPWCLHPDNAGRSRSYLDTAGWLRWSDPGRMAVDPDRVGHPAPMTSQDLMAALSYTQNRFDNCIEENGPDE
jgi:methylaspartate mutase epsilon subunit